MVERSVASPAADDIQRRIGASSIAGERSTTPDTLSRLARSTRSREPITNDTKWHGHPWRCRRLRQLARCRGSCCGTCRPSSSPPSTAQLQPSVCRVRRWDWEWTRRRPSGCGRRAEPLLPRKGALARRGRAAADMSTPLRRRQRRHTW
jgi:hypothetical protein